MKKFVLIVFLVFSFRAFAQDPVTTFGKTSFYVEWKYKPGDNPDNALSSLDDSSWNPVHNATEIKISDKDGWFWLRLRFSVPQNLNDKKILLTLGRAPFPSRVFLNGTPIFSRGDFPPEYNVQIGTPMTIPLPDELLSKTGQNILAIRGNYFGSAFTMTDTNLVDAASYEFEGWLSELLNARLFYLFSGILLFATVFFLFLFALRSKQREYLYIGLSCALMALYYYEIGAPRMIVPSWYIRVIMKACLNTSLVFLVHFIISFLKLKPKKFTVPLLYFIALISACIILVSVDETTLNSNYKLTLAFTLFFALSGLGRIFGGVMAGNRDAFPILAGGILAILTGLYDSLSILTGLEPFALLQGIGFFILDISIFVSIGMRIRRETLEAGEFE